MATAVADTLRAPASATRGRFGRGTPANPPAPAPTQTYVPRSARPLLFQPLDQQTRTAAGLTYDLENSTPTGSPGPTRLHVSRRANWRWINAGGDFIGANGVEQDAASPWLTIAANAGAGQTYSVTATALVNQAHAQDRHLAILVRDTGSIRTLASHRHATVAWRPVVQVTYADNGETAQLPCRVMALISGSDPVFATPATFGAEMQAPVVMEFTRPARAVSAATLALTVTQQFSGTQPLHVFLLNPPRNPPMQAAGLAASRTLDAGLETVPGVWGVQRFEDALPESTWISELTTNIFDTDFSPDCYGAGAADTSKLPYSAQGRWVNARYPVGQNRAENLQVVRSTYAAENFVPIAPGLGALRTTLVKDPAVAADGWVTNQNGTTGCDALLLLPPADMGRADRLRLRYAFRFYDEKVLGINDRTHGSNGTPAFLQHSGKWGPSWYGEARGGRSGTSGGGRGWQSRNSWLAAIDGADGPDRGAIHPGSHFGDDFKQPVPYANNGFNENWSDFGYGASIYPDTWHWLEVDIGLNTLTSSGIGRIDDGTMTVWLNRRRVLNRTGLHFRSWPLNPGTLAPTFAYQPGNTGNGTVLDQAGYASLVNSDAEVIPETWTLTFTSSTTYTVQGAFVGADAAGTVGADYISLRGHRWRVNAGAASWATGDRITITYPPYQTTPSSVSRTPWRELGALGINLNWFHGGRTANNINRTLFIAALAWGNARVMTNNFGPMNGAYF